jgi:hypothetical protein
VAQLRNEAVPRIDQALNPVRAAISLIAGGWATRIVISAVDAEQMLPAARLLARAAGVDLEPIWIGDGPRCDLVLTANTTAHA